MTEQLGTAGTADTAAAGRLSEKAIDYAASRGIGLETLAKLGAASGMAYFPRRIERKSEAVFFPYFAGGERVNYKACAFPDKDFIGQKGGKLAFFNLDNVLAGKMETVWIVEGEWDAAAMIEVGIPLDSVLSVPNGAREKQGNGEEEDEKPRGYGYVEEALEVGLSRVKRFVWCGDNDSAGLSLRGDMVHMLGAARFHYVEWPEGCKDANDYLRSDGAEALRELVTEGSLPWPVAGLYRAAEIPDEPPLTLWNPGFADWDEKVRLAPGTLSIVTGHPGHGKTALWAQIWFNICRAHDQVAAIATFETRPKPHYRRMLRTFHSGLLEYAMSDQEIAKADRWIDDHYLFLVHPEQKPSLDWVLEVAETAVVRHGARILQIDPWNRLEADKPHGESETDYIGRCLSAIYLFAQDMGCHVQILVHPSKMDGARRGHAPQLEDCAGSKHWENRCDQGFTVHRPKLFEGGERKTEADLYHRKARFQPELGYPCKLALRYDIGKGRYESAEPKTTPNML